jgi:hypothetical protein
MVVVVVVVVVVIMMMIMMIMETNHMHVKLHEQGRRYDTDFRFSQC